MLTCHKHYKIALFCGLSPPLDKSRTTVTVCDNQCWVEIKWEEEEGYWCAFRIAGPDLDCQIPIEDTTAGEY
jgi:hypothetical protein